MQIKRSGILIALGCVMLLGALGLTGFNFYTEQKAGDVSFATMEVLRVELPERNHHPDAPVIPTGTETGQDGDLALLETGLEIPDHVLNPQMDMPSRVIDGTEYIGVLEIPSQGLELPVVSRENTENLRKGPCRYAGSAYTNNLVIAGHNYRQHFGPVRDLRYGDVIRLTDLDGNVFRYEVVDMETIPPEGVEAMITGDWDLTLFTCTTGGSARVAVRCVRTDK